MVPRALERKVARTLVSALSSKEMGRLRKRTPKSGELTEITLRIDGAIVQVLNEEADRRSAESEGGPKWTRADVIRVILHDWMKAKPKTRK